MAPLQGYSKTHPFLSGIASRAVMQLPSNKITLQSTNMWCIAHGKLTALYMYVHLVGQPSVLESTTVSKKPILRFVSLPCYHCHYGNISRVSLETSEHSITDTHTHMYTYTNVGIHAHVHCTCTCVATRMMGGNATNCTKIGVHGKTFSRTGMGKYNVHIYARPCVTCASG